MSDFVDHPVTTFGLTGIQETRLNFGLSCPSAAIGHEPQLARTLGGNTAKTRQRDGKEELKSWGIEELKREFTSAFLSD
ncbi:MULTISPECIES: hypothetical protein [unclassified Mesorhizobium]|uniref:hypothetical protein n=1 Tax=Mesorhizobium TaxID=68287 RepID=UPI000FD5876F|nr:MULTISPECIES: hypothetical protein [unclassified Mesorhizobium]RUX43775.1 hypothetical protein EN994_28910 [Mesorhizobium sp. M7A.F.Ca.CA.002.09.1.1]